MSNTHGRSSRVKWTYKGRISVENEILIADDQEGIRLLLHDILVHEGYPVTAVTTGQAALEYLQSKSYSVTILDYHLPVMNGVDILKQMKNAQIHTEVLIITGMTETVEKELGETGLEAEVLAKPFNVQDMSTRVNSLMQGKEQC